MAKYHNKKMIIDGITFDSKKEGYRYQELKLLEKAGEITHLQLQPKFILQESFKKNGRTFREIAYISDFSYCDESSGSQVVVEDCKGFRTKEYQIKKKLFEKRYPDLTLVEI